MRISGGGARGIPLKVPSGNGVRPATDGLRQAVFSSLGARVAGARFADLFAGSGAYGLEAFSRGAAAGVFVERDPRTIACLKDNLSAVCRSLGAGEGSLEVIRGDAASLPLGGRPPPDLVFVDPPYELIAQVAPTLFANLSLMLASRPESLVVFELPGQIELAPEGWRMVKRIGKGARQPTAALFQPSAP